MDDNTPPQIADRAPKLTDAEVAVFKASADKVTATRFGAKVEVRVRGDDGTAALALVQALPRLFEYVAAFAAERMLLDSKLAAALTAASPED